MLKRGKYKIKVLNTINFAKSMHYNPFAYLRSEKDILKLVNTIIVNTKGEGQQSGEDFWVKAEKNGLPVVYDRLAVMAVSVFHLSHWRCDVTVDNYLLADGSADCSAPRP